MMKMMMLPKSLSAIALLAFMLSMAVLIESAQQKADMASPVPATLDCGSACAFRCSRASRAKLCLKDCNICCAKCSCVPPGTSGNREACPCYANLKNSKGKGKCP